MARKILLADDSVTAQNMGRRILSDAGYEVVTVNNGSAALKKIPEEKPELVILDVYMPGYGGVEVCQRLKDAAETAHIPVLLTVGKLEPFKAEEARRVRADAHLVKPFEASELLAAIIKLEDKIVPTIDSRGGGKAKERAKSSGFEAPEAHAAGKQKEKEKEKEKASEGAAEWKARLKIPIPSKAEEPVAAKPAPRRAAGFRNLAQPKAAPAKAAPPVAPAESIVPDITAEELAAIAAVAAALGENSEAVAAKPTNFAPEEAVASSPVHEEATRTFEEPTPEAFTPRDERFSADSANPYATIAATSAVEESAPPPDAYREPAASIGAVSEGTSSQVSEAVADSTAVEEPVATGETRSTVQSAIYSSLEAHDPDLAAALDSLAPVHVETPNEVDSYVSLIERISASATFPAPVNGAHWRAEEVALSQDEATCILEQEMEKAYAVMRAERIAETVPETEAAGTSVEAYASTAEVTDAATTAASHTWADMAWEDSQSAPHPHEALIAASYAERDAEMREESPAPAGEFVSRDESAPVLETSEAVAEGVSALPESVSVEAGATIEAEESTQFTEAVSGESVLAEQEIEPTPAEQPMEPVAASASETEGVLETTPEAQPPVIESLVMESAMIDSPVMAAPMIESMIAAVDGNMAAESQPAAAFAAAASGSYGFRTISRDEPTADQPAPEAKIAEEAAAPEAAATTPAEAEVAPERAAELAQAWAHWKQIRDSVASPQFTAQVAEVAAATLSENSKPASSSPDTDTSSAAAAADPAAIASIVESVLADLKPRLVAEIAKKLAKEK